MLSAGLIAAGSLPAQGPSIARELRIDAIAARHTALEAGASVILPGGVYARTSVTAAAGLANRNPTSAPVGRVEVVSRFLLDPLRESRYGLSVGGGLGVTNLVSGPRWQPYLACVFDLELKRRGSMTPAIQLGLGGGARLGVALRSGSERWR